MLYVSTRDGRRLFGVTDTDDGVTEYYRYSDLLHFVKDLGFVIEGCDLDSRSSAFNVHVVNPNRSKKEIKALVLKNLSVSVVDDTLTSLQFSKPMTETVRIVLSKFCSKIGDFSINSYLLSTQLRGSAQVILVFDSKLTIEPKAFDKAFYSDKVIFDITDAENKLTTPIYKNYVRYTPYDLTYNKFCAAVYDKNPRFYFHAVELLMIAGEKFIWRDTNYYTGLSLNVYMQHTKEDLKSDCPEVANAGNLYLKRHKKDLMKLCSTAKRFNNAIDNGSLYFDAGRAVISNNKHNLDARINSEFFIDEFESAYTTVLMQGNIKLIKEYGALVYQYGLLFNMNCMPLFYYMWFYDEDEELHNLFFNEFYMNLLSIYEKIKK